MEAEFIAANETTKEVAWFEKLWKDIKPAKQPTPTLWCDNEVAIVIINIIKYHSKAKYIGTRYFFVRNDMVK